MGEIVAFQDEFRQALLNVTGNVDYEIFRKPLARIAELIKLSKVDQKVIAEAVRLSQVEYNLNRQAQGKEPKQLTNKENIRIQQRTRLALRCGVARHAEAHRDILINRREETRFSENQARQIIERIDSVLSNCPKPFVRRMNAL